VIGRLIRLLGQIAMVILDPQRSLAHGVMKHSLSKQQFVLYDQQFPDGLSPRGFWGSERSEEGFARTMGLVRLALS